MDKINFQVHCLATHHLGRSVFVRAVTIVMAIVENELEGVFIVQLYGQERNFPGLGLSF